MEARFIQFRSLQESENSICIIQLEASGSNEVRPEVVPAIYNTDAHIDYAVADVKQALSTIFQSKWR
jgi:hypothetical protein